MKAITKKQESSLLPEFVGNLIKSVNSASRVVLKTTESCERLVDGLDELATIGISNHADRLRKQLKSGKAA